MEFKTPIDIANALVNDDDSIDLLKSRMGNGIVRSVQFLNEESADVASPTRHLLEALNLLEAQKDQEKTTWSSTPFSKQAITAGVTLISKFGGISVILVSLGSAIYTFLEASSSSEQGVPRLVLWACATVIISVAMIVGAVIVRADLIARGQVSAAQYQARANAATAYLKSSEQLVSMRVTHPLNRK